jgi:predicted RND superfamily exporter protein
MGMAFGVALILIYMLVVMEFGNFSLPAIIMAPIPLTLVGIVPGHWLLGAEFTATSMIGFIALAGIIVRNSILLVDFTKHEVLAGRAVTESVLLACKARTRPILVTAFALVGGAGVIILDPIFKGMAISLAFGVLVSTVLTLIVIPLGCISVRETFAVQKRDINGKKLAGELPYDAILEGTSELLDDVDEGSDKGVGDYFIGLLNNVWLAITLFVQWIICLFMDIVAIFTGLFAYVMKKLSSDNVKDESVSASSKQNKTNIIKDEPSTVKNDVIVEKVESTDTSNAIDANSKKESLDVVESEVVDPVIEKTEEKTTPVKNTVKKKAVTNKANIKKTSAKKAVTKRSSTKKASVKKAVSKKAVAKAKSSRRGNRLKSDLDDNDKK